MSAISVLVLVLGLINVVRGARLLDVHGFILGLVLCAISALVFAVS